LNKYTKPKYIRNIQKEFKIQRNKIIFCICSCGNINGKKIKISKKEIKKIMINEMYCFYCFKCRKFKKQKILNIE